MKDWNLQKKWHIYVIAVIMIIAFFVRGYRFEDFLLFRFDQVRDISYVQAVQEEGLGELRLLGPNAGVRVALGGEERNERDFFRLGPVYYYFQTLSAFIFREVSPRVMAYPDFIFSLLAIPLFFVFISLFLKRRVSILTTAVFAFSFVLLQYSRFAWNVNQLIFWEILLMLGVYKTSFSKSLRKSGGWMLVSFISFAILAQLHLLALVGFPIVMILFWTKYRPKVKLKYWAFSIFITLIIFSPILASELKNNADNFKRFHQSFKEEDKSKEGFTENISDLSKYEGGFFVLATTSLNRTSVEQIRPFGILFIIFSVLLLAFRFKKEKKNEKAFIILTFLWFFIFLLIFWRILPKLPKVRYWLLIAPLPFIFLGIFFDFLENKFKNRGFWVSLSLAAILVTLNFQAIFYLYGSLEKGEKIGVALRGKPTIRIYRELITFEALDRAIDSIAAEAQSQSKALCYKSLSSQSARPVNYLLENKYPTLKAQLGLSRGDNSNCVFFVITNLDSDKKDVLEEGEDQFYLVEERRFAGVNVWNVKLKTEENKQRISEGVEITPNNYTQRMKGVNNRLGGRAITWSDLWE